ncbi:Aste57867_23018 [Aphanomyces stellatus]|uniref:Aste57867_23018 protein n=1 Tax=Aphanomyces stellatus TaxID=120398 RepID=A0A485LM35_9STRA|nr:hypothetical protein As57867_022947 [Aphanomyces stellatus]VFT99666.1 Aste57867_23018 [Aphanomyces stellatus]
MNNPGGAFFMPNGAGNPNVMNPGMNMNMGFMMPPPGAPNDGSQGMYMNGGMGGGLGAMHSFGTSTGDAMPSPSSNSAAGGSFNRGNYRCSRCGEPKKGHVCPYQPANYKCNKCGNLKRSCTCGAPQKINMEVQCALDEHMTVAKLDRSAQGVTEFHESVRSFVDGAN